MAMKFGVDLLPTYVFGENQIFKMSQGAKNTHAGYYVAPFPGIDFAEFLRSWTTRKKEIKVAVGEPIRVEINRNPSDQEVENLFNEYCEALEKAFYMFSDDFLPK